MKQFTFTLTEEEANIIMMGLQELPLKLSLRVVQKLQAQAMEKVEPKVES